MRRGPEGRAKVVRARADVLVQRQGLAETRTKAHALILAGQIVSGDHRVDKPGQLLDETAPLRRKGALPGTPEAEASRYVSRGGVKLAHALDVFKLDPKGCVCVDLGASTGGFTDVLLQRGAKRVFAVDVGRGQLHSKLAQDPRVRSFEKVNARTLSLELLGERCSVAVADLSFISLRLVLPALLGVLLPGAFVVVLVKPQFEAGRAEVGKGGVVRDPAVHARVVAEISAELVRLGLSLIGSDASPLLGPAGNREFVLGARLVK